MPDVCREVRTLLDRHCQRETRDPRSLSLALFAGICVAETEAGAGAMMERLLAGGRPQMRATDNWVKGSPERAAERVRELSAAGIDRLMFSVEREEHIEMVRILGERVAPLIG